MAHPNLDKFSVKEALNIDASITWERHSSSPATVTTSTTSHITISASAVYVLIETDQDLYLYFSTGSADAIDATKDVRFIGGTGEYFKLRVPRGLSGTVYLHLKAVTATATVKIVEN